MTLLWFQEYLQKIKMSAGEIDISRLDATDLEFDQLSLQKSQQRWSDQI